MTEPEVVNLQHQPSTTILEIEGGLYVVWMDCQDVPGVMAPSSTSSPCALAFAPSRSHNLAIRAHMASLSGSERIGRLRERIVQSPIEMVVPSSALPLTSASYFCFATHIAMALKCSRPSRYCLCF